MDRDSIERIRTATFTVARRGYEKRQVDHFLVQLADWLETGGEDDARSEVVRTELERIGKETSKILTDAHDVAAGLRAGADREADEQRSAADRYASGVRAEADTHSERTHIEADEYASETRGEADAYAARARKEANAEAATMREDADEYAITTRRAAEEAADETRLKAEQRGEQIVEEAARKRSETEKLIADLE
ncbi:MAG: DivIVA domain-containing protein, partial [bacterium]